MVFKATALRHNLLNSLYAYCTFVWEQSKNDSVFCLTCLLWSCLDLFSLLGPPFLLRQDGPNSVPRSLTFSTRLQRIDPQFHRDTLTVCSANNREVLQPMLVILALPLSELGISTSANIVKLALLSLRHKEQHL